MPTADMHVHTNYSPDSEAPMAAQVQAALERGLKTVAITDHADWLWPSRELEYPIDVELRRHEYDKLTAWYGGHINIIWGVECGLYDDALILEKVRAYLKAMKPDYVIGSQHEYLGEQYHSGYWDEHPQDGYSKYFADMLDCVLASDYFHTLGHMDYIKRYAPPDAPPLVYAEHAETVEKILRELAARGLALELNTDNRRHSVSDKTFMAQALRRFRELGGRRVVVGSDAHKPEYVAAGFEKAAEVLASAGVEAL